MANVYETRLDRCRELMHQLGIDSLILTPGAAMRYLTGFSEEAYERLLCLIVPDSRPLRFICPTLNRQQTLANLAQVKEVIAWDDNEGWETILRDAVCGLDLNTGIVGVDDNMPARFLLKLLDIVPSSLVKSAGSVFAALRSVKDEDELAKMQRAAELTDQAFHAALRACKPGITEAQLATVVGNTIHGTGGEMAFSTIIGSGPNSALPHHSAGSRQIQQGEIVLFDLGAKLDGYCGDITRVVSMGEPSAEAAKIYDIVYRAQSKAVERAAPGVPASFVDRVARELIADAGYGEYFFHRTGHGIGMEDHEAPNIVHGNDEPLKPGNCFSIEPGIYLAGNFGIRLENIVTITEVGRHVFNEPIAPRLMDIEELLG